MRRKDDLLRLAFGELNDDAARAVEAGADAAERAELETFRDLRRGLQHLPPPPPDGLSAERLRAAILDRELRARPRAFAWGPALLAPAACAALAAVLILPRLRPQAQPQIVADNLRLESAKPFAFDPVGPVRSSPPMRDIRTRSEPAPRLRVRVADADSRPTRRLRRATPNVENKPGLGYVASVSPPAVEGAATSAPSLTLAKREPATMAPPPSSVVEQAPGTSGGTETVVIVSNQRDLETGALAATEKEVGSVLVGG